MISKLIEEGIGMSSKNMYPIKYAVLELKEHGGWVTGYKDIVRGNIVSKCYVVESSIKYFSSGESQIFHKVVFPFSDLETFKQSLRNQSEYIGEKTAPRYDANGNPYPVDIVAELFDTYEDAKIKAHEQNENLKHQIISRVLCSISDASFKQKLADYEKEYMEQLSICELFEKNVLLNTEDMNITHEMNENKKLQLLK